MLADIWAWCVVHKNEIVLVLELIGAAAAGGVTVGVYFQRIVKGFATLVRSNFTRWEEAKKKPGTLGKAAEIICKELGSATQELPATSQKIAAAINAEVDEKKEEKPFKRKLLGLGLRLLLRR